jgi:hypothetical protein
VALADPLQASHKAKVKDKLRDDKPGAKQSTLAPDDCVFGDKVLQYLQAVHAGRVVIQCRGSGQEVPSYATTYAGVSLSVSCALIHSVPVKLQGANAPHTAPQASTHAGYA